jgi:hypothetical protein
VKIGLQAAVKRLPLPDKTLLRRRFGLDHRTPASWDQLATDNQCSVSEIKNRCNQLLAALRTELEKHHA